MDPRDLYPSCVLKVDLDCCQTCVVRLKKLLSKIHGVYAVDVDAEKGLVKVWGKVDPAILIKKIAERKKKAELLSYEDPMNRQNRGTQNTQTGKYECCGGGDSDYQCGFHQEEPFTALGNNSSVPVPMIRPQHFNVPPRPNPHYPHPRTGPYWRHYREVSEMESPNFYGRPLPNNESSCSCCPHPPYNGYYATRYVPGGTSNDFTHFFSDENDTGCSIL